MRFLKTATVASVLAILATGATAALAKDATDSRDVDAFTKVVIKGAMDVNIEAGKKQSVEISTDDDYLDRVETKVENGTLYISMRGRRWRDVEVTADIAVKSLERFNIEGAADAHITGVDSGRFDVVVDGAGDIYLEGKCGTADFQINGAGDLDAEEFKCENVTVIINGAGDAEVYASKSITAQINGVGDIEVHGDPDDVNPRISGLGQFSIH